MIEYSNNMGNSMEDAIIIQGASNNFAGVAAEFIYLSNKFGRQGKDWILKEQALLEINKIYYETIIIILPDGTKKTIYFDISDFYGKF